MNWFKRLVGGRTPVEQLERAFAQGEWADVLRMAEACSDNQLGSEDQQRVEELVNRAGDRLAAINLEESRACLQIGETQKAIEHLVLAAQQARDPQLREDISVARKQLGQSDEVSGSQVVPNLSAAHACVSCGPNRDTLPEMDQDLDPNMQWELFLAGLPEEWSARYEARSPDFRQAVTLSHQGDVVQALSVIGQVPEDEKDDLFLYETAGLQLRSDLPEKGMETLGYLLQDHPGHALGLQMLVDVAGQLMIPASLHERLRQNLEAEIEAGLSHAALAKQALFKGDTTAAFEEGLAALRFGFADAELVVFCATGLERSGDTDRAEALLRSLSGGGCGGGPHPLLGEFWLRQSRNLDQALESFKRGLKAEPDNSRWRLRIAQTYLSRGWEREGRALLHQALADPGLAPELRSEGEKWLEGVPHPEAGPK